MIQKMFAAFIMLFLATEAYAQEETATTTNAPKVTSNQTTTTVTPPSDSTNTVITAPPTAISPTISASNSDLCTVGVSGAVQTQILGISAGTTVRDMNCEKLKNAVTLYNMGMKVAAVSVMCQDERVFRAMMDAGTPCPIDGKIGEEAKSEWEDPTNQDRRPDSRPGIGMNIEPDTRTTLIGGAVVLGILAVLLGG